MFLLNTPIDGIDLILLIALLIVSVALSIAVVASTVFRIIIFFSYWVTNRQKSSGGYSGATAALKLLAELGYTDIKVEKCGFFKMLFYGNHYNPDKNTIYLRASTYNGENLTTVGLALQKVALVIQDKKDGSVRSRWRLQQISLFGPILFIPIVIIGLVVDFLTVYISGTVFTGYATMICAVVGAAFFIVCLVLSFLTIKVEGRANKEALEIIKNYDFLNDDEQEKIAKIFKTYLFAYITDFIVSLLQIIKFILKLLLAIRRTKK